MGARVGSKPSPRVGAVESAAAPLGHRRIRAAEALTRGGPGLVLDAHAARDPEDGELSSPIRDEALDALEQDLGHPPILVVAVAERLQEPPPRLIRDHPAQRGAGEAVGCEPRVDCGDLRGHRRAQVALPEEAHQRGVPEQEVSKDDALEPSAVRVDRAGGDLSLLRKHAEVRIPHDVLVDVVVLREREHDEVGVYLVVQVAKQHVLVHLARVAEARAKDPGAPGREPLPKRPLEVRKERVGLLDPPPEGERIAQPEHSRSFLRRVLAVAQTELVGADLDEVRAAEAAEVVACARLKQPQERVIRTEPAGGAVGKRCRARDAHAALH